MNIQNTYQRKLSESLAIDAKRIHTIMLIAAIIIFPIFAFFDRYTLPAENYWTVTTIRLSITFIVAIWLLLQTKFGFAERYLSYFAFSSISWFCVYACVEGGNQFLYQHNIAYCTVFLSASLFILWHWYYSLSVVLSSIALYIGLVYFNHEITLTKVMFSGGSVLLSIMILHPVIVAFRFNAYKREFYLKEKIEASNELLKKENEEAIQRNQELQAAREEANDANHKLRNVNQYLEEEVKLRTHGLQDANAKMKAAMDELDLFLYSSYHDLKSPIARMKGLLDLLKKEGTHVNTEEHHHRLISTLTDMEDLIEKLNTINTFTNYELTTEKVSPIETLNEVLNQQQQLIRDAELEIQISESLTIQTDKKLLKSILKCLIENALIYRKDEGKHHVRISIQRNSKFELSVWDNGIGISENILPNIFEMYYRGTEKSVGHGLGLFITKKAIDKLQGSIGINSKPGEFTEFKLSF
jgi:signal transduction histidine kinase